MSTDTAARETAHSTLLADVARVLPSDVAWLVREPRSDTEADTETDTVRLLVGERLGLIRGVLDGQGYAVREADVPVRDGWQTLLEVTR